MAISFFVYEIKRDWAVMSKNRDFLYLPVMYITTITPRKITASILRCFLYNRSIWLDYNMMQITAEKFNPLSMLHQRRYTDRQTELRCQ